MKIDLHGIRHRDVDRLVENFVLLNQEKTPLEIVCGNSQKMIDLVLEVIRRLDCESYEQFQGIVMVRKV
mgnify:FL=1